MPSFFPSLPGATLFCQNDWNTLVSIINKVEMDNSSLTLALDSFIQFLGLFPL